MASHFIKNQNLSCYNDKNKTKQNNNNKNYQMTNIMWPKNRLRNKKPNKTKNAV